MEVPDIASFDGLNEKGSYATSVLLKNFDTDESKIVVGHENFTSKGLYREVYQTLYGELDVERLCIKPQKVA